MEKYIVLANWTDQTRKTLDKIPEALEMVRSFTEELGGSVSFCFTLGEYDVVGIFECPTKRLW